MSAINSTVSAAAEAATTSGASDEWSGVLRESSRAAIVPRLNDSAS